MTSTTTGTTIGLRDGVYVCRTQDIQVFLDVWKDKYFCLDRAKSARFAEMQKTPHIGNLSPGARELAERLVSAGFLTRGGGRRIAQPSRPAPTASAYDDLSDAATEKPLRHGIVFAACVARAAYLRRRRAFRGVVDAMARTKSGSRRQGTRPPDAELRRAISLARLAEHLAPYFYTSRDQCFFTSFLLADFLTRCGVDACWEFGVRVSPFGAHCWVEHQGVVLNDSLAHVLEFEKIMSV
ncbi:MAG: lasso peptide biosynthesis B2 protein [Oricola sp.]|jgi:hypothetical protein|nr:lasso peptide biosynthesis B2 protein [Oricola sp.]